MIERRQLISSSVWSGAGFAVSQLVRLFSNLVLTRILFPEVFGLMALVQSVVTGVKMFSDMGIATSVLRDKAGDDPAYLDTAWTMQVIRGIAIWLIISILAYPAATLYDAPELFFLLPVVGLGAIVQGFNSTSILSLKRNFTLRSVVLWEVSIQLLTAVSTIYLAWKLQSVWALVLGGLIGATIGAASSFRLKLARRPKFHLDRDVFANIFRFGKWIFLSTALTYIIQQGDVLVLGLYLPLQTLGLYAIAIIWSRIVLQLLLKLNEQIMLPLYARYYHEDRDSVRKRISRSKAILLAITIPGVCGFVVGGQFLVDILYDPRYQEAGWMLQILSVGTIGSIISVTSGNALLSFGDSLSFMKFQIARGLFMGLCMFVGGAWYGTVGIVIGVAVSRFAAYPVLAYYLHQHKIWMPKLDLAALLAAFSLIILSALVFSPSLIWRFLP